MNNESLIKVSDQVLDFARVEARKSKRGVAAQIDHWARIGKAIESSPGFDYTRIRNTLTGKYDAALLTEDEEAVYFGELGLVFSDAPATEELHAANRQKAIE